MANGPSDDQGREDRGKLSFKSLDSEAMRAARAAAQAAGMSLEEWLSRTILQNAPRRPSGDESGAHADSPAPRDTTTRTVGDRRVSFHIDRPHMQKRGTEGGDGSGQPGDVDNVSADTEATPTFPEMPLAKAETEHERLARIITSRRAEHEQKPAAKKPAVDNADLRDDDTLEPLTLSTLPETPMPSGSQRSNRAPGPGGRYSNNGAPPPRRREKKFSWFWATVFVLLALIAGAIWALPYLPKPGEPAKAPGTANSTASVAPPADTNKARPADPSKPAAPPDAGKADAAKKPAPSPTPEPGTTTEKERLLRTPVRAMPKPPGDHAAWYLKAAEAGNTNAQYILATLYLQGAGVEKNLETAAKWFRTAADGGLSAAQYALGVLYTRGIGVKKDEVEAALLFQKAADQGNVLAITQTGIAYLEGRGVKRDLAKARSLLERAAEAGEVNAMYTLGRIYESGTGTDPDKVQALKWFILASERKHRIAAQRVEDLSSDLSQDAQNKATELAREHNQRYGNKKN